MIAIRLGRVNKPVNNVDPGRRSLDSPPRAGASNHVEVFTGLGDPVEPEIFLDPDHDLVQNEERGDASDPPAVFSVLVAVWSIRRIKHREPTEGEEVDRFIACRWHRRNRFETKPWWGILLPCLAALEEAEEPLLQGGRGEIIARVAVG